VSSLSAIRGNVRKDLHDEDSAAYRWTDAVLERHIKRALREYSLVSPLEVRTTLQTETDSREVDVSTLTPRVRIVAAEYPAGEYPPSYVPFSLWADALTLDLTGAPAGTPDVNVYWHKAHDINGTVTFPATDDDLIATGAAAYAALDWASFATNRVNVGGESVWGRYVEFGRERLAQFHEQLRRLPAVRRLRTSRLYLPEDVRFTSQTTDPGPL